MIAGLLLAALATLGLAAYVGRRRLPLRAGAHALLGQACEVRDPVDATGHGRVLVRGELWQACSREPIPAGAQARVVAVLGLLVEVEPLVFEES